MIPALSYLQSAVYVQHFVSFKFIMSALIQGLDTAIFGKKIMVKKNACCNFNRLAEQKLSIEPNDTLKYL